ncbi:hypothetical protein [Massilia sp. YMA4]|uniref:hypothetical protein n=1 Tax=Massilia sp. YMA4 TaxID=1593482 RepID=UPI001581F96C|nr:hypothetical protein [Massilia sp. YMA4]
MSGNNAQLAAATTRSRNRADARVWRERLSCGDQRESRSAMDPACNIPAIEYRLGCMRFDKKTVHMLDEIGERSNDRDTLPLHFTRAQQVSFDDVRHALIYESTIAGGYFTRLLFKFFYKYRKFDD